MANNVNIPSTQEVVAYLERIEPGELPLDVFVQTARLLTMATVELVPVRKNDKGETEVLLTQRDANDPVWPNIWHIPGSIILPKDELKHPNDYSAALDRVLGKELEGSVKALAEPTYVGTERRSTLRGAELSALHWVEVEGEPAVGKFVSIKDFPENVPAPGVIDHHIDFIPRVVAHYEEHKAQQDA